MKVFQKTNLFPAFLRLKALSQVSISLLQKFFSLSILNSAAQMVFLAWPGGSDISFHFILPSSLQALLPWADRPRFHGPSQASSSIQHWAVNTALNHPRALPPSPVCQILKGTSPSCLPSFFLTKFPKYLLYHLIVYSTPPPPLFFPLIRLLRSLDRSLPTPLSCWQISSCYLVYSHLSVNIHHNQHSCLDYNIFQQVLSFSAQETSMGVNFRSSFPSQKAQASS